MNENIKVNLIDVITDIRTPIITKMSTSATYPFGIPHSHSNDNKISGFQISNNISYIHTDERKDQGKFN